MWVPVTSPTARFCELDLCAVGAARGRLGGGASGLSVGRAGSGALSSPTARPLGRAAGAHYPLPVGAGGADVGTRHQPHSARSCVLAWRAVGAPRGCLGGAPPAWVWGVWGQALSHPRPLVHSGACGRAQYPLAVGMGDAGVGTRHQPHSARPCELALRVAGAAPGCPGGGASCLGVGRPGWGAIPPPTARPFRRVAEAHYPLPVGAGGPGVGTRHQPHSARSCELALRAVGAARGRPGGAPLAPVWGARGRALSHARPIVLSGVQPGPTTHWLWVREMRAWGPVTNPTARALASLLWALWGRHEGAWGGGASCLGVQGRALSHPRPPVLWGVRPGPTTHWMWVRGVRAWGTVTNSTARALACWLCALWGRHEGAGGGPFCLGAGRPGSGALSPPTTRTFWREAGAHYPLAVGAGDAGVGTRQQPHSARSCELALRAVGAA